MGRAQIDNIHPEKLIIIGVTGPVASGCTTVARFLADNKYEDVEGLQAFLQMNKYFVDNEINFEKYENEIKSLYRRRLEIDKDIAETASHRLQNLEFEAEELHGKLKRTLEKREVIESLDYLLPTKDYKKESRRYISVSDIIIWKCIINLETEPNLENKQDKINKTKEIINDKLNTAKASCKEFNKLYGGIRDFFYHLHHPDEKPNLDDFSKCFDLVGAMKNELVKLEFYREMMQDFGDNIRSTGNPFYYLEPNPNKPETYKPVKDNNLSLAKDLDFIVHYLMSNSIYFVVVDCFRNPNTAKFLRDKYSKFYLVSLFANRDKRLERLTNKESKRKNYSFDHKGFEKKFREYDERDEGKKLPLKEKLYKQNITDTSLVSDIAINNEGTKEALFSKLIRYIGLILDPGCTKPTGDEMFMNLAYTMAMKSNCISRQAGAVIEGGKGYVVGAGWNDVGEGQISCGLRNIRDLYLPAFRAYLEALDPKDPDSKRIASDLEKRLGEKYYCFCFKDEMSINEVERELEKVLKDFRKSLSKELEKKEERSLGDLANAVRKDFQMKRLEYCKALHAEENAIIQGAKIGGMGVKGGTMYVTTFPCELCAKKIHQVGIDKVVYTEPYPGTISKKIYLEDGVSKVKSRQFEGVKPYGYFQLFKPFYDQKEWQELDKSELVD